ncbi:MAG: dicarboxylate/amino acid:cation symporter [Legionellales bacterium]|nr:dicarboxylate/amino acid:cation symporter [Legionellales bacterium]
MNIYIFTLLGIIIGIFEIPILIEICDFIEQAFIKIFKLISLPIFFLSIICCISNLESIDDFKQIGKKTMFYTISTTSIAAVIALFLYIVISPKYIIPNSNIENPVNKYSLEYSEYLLNIIPNNIFTPFIEYNLFAILFIAVISGFAIYKLPSKQKFLFQIFFKNTLALCTKITEFIIYLLPIGIMAFIAIMIKNIASDSSINQLFLYFVCIVLANLIQGTIVLPGILHFKKIPPLKVFKVSRPALTLAFFSKSSSATLPVSINCAINKLKIDPKIARFTLPICTTINMNACAGFILITILFVLQSNGVYLDISTILGVLLFSIIAAIGNASVPMGCYFMTTTFLVAIKMPIDIMTTILPFYLILDMLETSINVWSDICITNIVNKEINSIHS